MPILNEADALYLGDEAVDAVYLGTEKLWPSLGWSPADLGGLAVWFDASQLELADGAAVSPWPNLGSGADGIIYGFPAPYPILRWNALNGLPVVRFTTNEGRLRMTGTGVGKNYTLVYVGRKWDAASQGRVLGCNYPQSNSLWGFWGAQMDVAHEGPIGFYAPNVPRATTTEWMLYSADSGPSVDYLPRLFIDGVFKSQIWASNGDGMNGTLNISGYDATGTQETSHCEVAEVVVYDHKLSDAERVQVEDYLREKWGL